MSVFEWEFFHRERGGDEKPETTLGWYRRQPSWLKLAYVIVVLPAWLVILFNMLTGNPKSISSLIAFSLFGLVALAAIVTDHRRNKGGAND